MARTVTTNAIDIIIIWLSCRLYCRKDEILRTKERCRPFFGTQYLLFSFSHDYSKLMAFDNTSRILFSCYCFFLFFCHFHLKQNSRGCTFRIYKHACFDALKKYLAITNSSPVNTLFSSCFILRSSLFLRGEGLPNKYGLGLPFSIFWYGRIRLCQQAQKMVTMSILIGAAFSDQGLLQRWYHR